MPPLQSAVIELIVENSVKRFKESLGWKASFIDAEDTENYRKEIRQVVKDCSGALTIQEARKA